MTQVFLSGIDLFILLITETVKLTMHTYGLPKKTQRYL